MEEYIKIVDAHSHLWLHQHTIFDGKPVETRPNGRALFMGEERQMLPPFMIDGRNSAEVFLSNMDYARVSASVVTQEFIDGQQNEYLSGVHRRYPDRFFVFGMPEWRCPGFCEETRRLLTSGFRGIKLPAARLINSTGRISIDTPEMMATFHLMEQSGAILGIELTEGTTQIEEMETIIAECPELTIVIGHFGMVTRPGWQEQIKLARHAHVYVESGGITWLFNDEFYPFPSAVKSIREAIDLVGVDKLMWGSDYPRTITAITYRMSYDFILHSSLLTLAEKKAFLSDNAARVFGFHNLIELPYIKNMSE
jgi:predicted TIM-barrel fold metal-dependent hydrolase